ncbi:class B sortase [Clostridium sp. Sa3CUN1]|uniref:Class B sortase n=1 Tax=Clostridium gallinarum TaxID=2762246 RepID=A0ABR8Q3K3_9CLOT|nr:class B sortase [Clostridium gallinarum]
MNKKFINIVKIILYFIIIVCLIIIGIKKYNYYKSDKTYDSIREIKNNNVVSTEENNKLNHMYEELKSINPDYKFWITVEETVIDYPVVKGEDNDFYLSNDFYKENSISGAIFLDYKNTLEDKNLILYGHNMRDGSMFAAINKFKEKDFFDSGKIKIVTENEERSYEVFSVFVEAANDINLKSNFISEEDYIKYINELKKKSYYKNNIDSDFSNIITLYTCSYEFENARTIVCAVLN